MRAMAVTEYAAPLELLDLPVVYAYLVTDGSRIWTSSSKNGLSMPFPRWLGTNRFASLTRWRMGILSTWAAG